MSRLTTPPPEGAPTLAFSRQPFAPQLTRLTARRPVLAPCRSRRLEVDEQHCRMRMSAWGQKLTSAGQMREADSGDPLPEAL
jgi:hypothetical protein